MAGKRNNVRSHDQEKKWLERLGQGNLVEGVQQLVRKELNKPGKSGVSGGKRLQK